MIKLTERACTQTRFRSTVWDPTAAPTPRIPPPPDLAAASRNRNFAESPRHPHLGQDEPDMVDRGDRCAMLPTPRTLITEWRASAGEARPQRPPEPEHKACEETPATARCQRPARPHLEHAANQTPGRSAARPVGGHAARLPGVQVLCTRASGSRARGERSSTPVQGPSAQSAMSAFRGAGTGRWMPATAACGRRPGVRTSKCRRLD